VTPITCYGVSSYFDRRPRRSGNVFLGRNVVPGKINALDKTAVTFGPGLAPAFSLFAKSTTQFN
jgi:hypothetical protein